MLKALANAATLKSKTINGNVLAGAIVTILTQFGVTIPLEVVSAGFIILNTILRLITKEPLEDK